MDAIELSLFSARLSAVCDEMGVLLQRTALSSNIKDRLDFSCAVFDQHGELCAQAAHIPVHMGSMAYAMRDIVQSLDWSAGDMVMLNDPFLGGTHLPDVTVIAPLFFQGELLGFVANRAHHADIGATSPGSMPVSRRLDEEGLIISPGYIMRRGVIDQALMESICSAMRNAAQGRGDFSAQISANSTGIARLEKLVDTLGPQLYRQGLQAVNDYAERLALSGLADIPDGIYQASDLMDDDGLGHNDIPIKTRIKVYHGRIQVDFSGTAPQVEGNINCPLSVAAAAVYYVFRCLMPVNTPACAGSFRPLTLYAPEGCLVNARRPAAVTAGNVETSSRIVDVILSALVSAIPARIPAASQGSMNNIAMGGYHLGRPWDYYETLGGGMGAGPDGPGLSAIQTHMTNTRNTPIESAEMHFPLRIRRYQIRAGSGGVGRYRGGDGVEREYQFLADGTVTLLTERRMHSPPGAHGGGDGAIGENWLNERSLPAKVSIDVVVGDRLVIKTPGGGGWGAL